MYSIVILVSSMKSITFVRGILNSIENLHLLSVILRIN